jgi:hypothetical protein
MYQGNAREMGISLRAAPLSSTSFPAVGSAFQRYLIRGVVVPGPLLVRRKGSGANQVTIGYLNQNQLL